MLHWGVHGNWSSAFYRYLHVVDFLLNVPEPLLPRPIFIEILSGGLVRIMLPGVSSFTFSIRFLTRVEVLFFSGNRVLVFSGLSCLLGCRICLVSCSNSFNKCWLVMRSASTSSVLACTISNRLREVCCPRHLAGLASLEDWRCSCLCSELIPSVDERSALFVKELLFPQKVPN